MKIQAQSKLTLNLLAVFSTMMSTLVEGHGRLRDPPSRSSAWREGFPVPPDYNDTEGFCGGFERQWLVNKGKCGVCGDPFDESIKPHEAPGGVFATGTIVRNYTEGQVVPVKIDITALHKGFYQFKICPNNNVNLDPPQSCFDNMILSFVDGGAPFTKYDVNSLTTGKFEVQLQLPPGLTCRQCIIQWTYVTGNRWGTCTNGTEGLGCGPQEQFLACADVSIFPKGGNIPVTTGPTVIEPVTTTMAPITMTPITMTPITMTPTTEQPIVITSSFPTVQPITLPASTTQPSLLFPTSQPPVITLPPLTIPPTVGKCSSYIPVPSQQMITGMTEWCNNNCRRGYCPLSYCVCVQ